MLLAFLLAEVDESFLGAVEIRRADLHFDALVIGDLVDVHFGLPCPLWAIFGTTRDSGEGAAGAMLVSLCGPLSRLMRPCKLLKVILEVDRIAAAERNRANTAIFFKVSRPG